MSELQHERWVGREVSLRQLAQDTGSPHAFEQFARPPYNWIKQKEQKDQTEYGIAHLRNVLLFDVFNIYAPDTRQFVTEVSYVNSLSTFNVPHERNDDTLTVFHKNKIIEISDPVLIIGGHNNHYHWLLNWLPRFRIWEKFFDSMGSPKRIKVATHFDLSPPHRESLHMLGIDDSDIIKLQPGVLSYHLKNAFVPTFFSQLCYYQEVLDFLHDLSAPMEDDPIPGIYVTRNNITQPRRRVVNESEVRALVAGYGLQCVSLEDLSMHQQMYLFRNSNAIVAGHGAGLANLAFARRGSDCLIAEHKIVSEFAEIALLTGVRCQTILAELEINEAFELQNPNFHWRNRDFKFDVKSIDSFLSDVRRRRS